jgi:uncharacterized membrane protein
MEPEITLLGIFLLSLLFFRTTRGTYNFALSGRIAMAAMLTVTGIAHFAFSKGMALMIPEIIPFRMELIYITGVLELLAAIGLLVNRFSAWTGWLLIAFFVLLLPANIYGYMKHVDMQKATFDGKGPVHLWYRIPLQAIFIGWTYISAIKRTGLRNRQIPVTGNYPGKIAQD